jgi:hypothetical protein
MDYTKHLIECKCILPQFKNRQPIIFHSFIVFSVVEENGDIQVSFAQCPNCAVIHKVTEIGVSSILRKEEMSTLMTIDEIKSSLPEGLITLAQGYDLPLSSWQEIQFILENKMWGQRPVILSKEEVEGIKTGKYLAIVGENLYQVKSFSRENYTK